MTADKPSSLVPKLRFPEFEKAGDWELKALSSVAEPISEKVGTTKCVPMSITTGVGLVSQEDKFGRIIAGDSYKNYIKLQANDFAYNKSATKEFPQGFIARYAGDGAAGVPNSIFTCFRLDAAAVLPEYLDHLFQSNHHGRWLRKYITVGARAHGALSVSDDDLFAMPVPLPPAKVSRNEQKKIADCLGSLDDLTATEGRKLEALRQHKQGLMAQLFPQGDESVPRLRFPEFQDAGKWEMTTIGNMGEVITGSTPSTSSSDFYGGEFLFVTPGDISELRYVECTKKTLTEAGFAECRPVAPNSILFVCIGSTIGKVAQCLRPCATNQQINSLVTNAAFVADFAYYLLDNESARIALLAGRQAVPIINKTLFAAVEVFAPAPPEQKRIADCLSSIDVGLAAQAARLSSLTMHRQGLLQQLFPRLEEEAQ
jgi:type I restriction enzyme S subunit